MTPQTIANYAKRAADGEQPFVRFMLDTDEALAAYVCRSLGAIDSAGMGAAIGEKRERGDFKALCWILERLHPKDFAIVTKGEVIVKDRARAVDDPTPQAAAAIVRAVFGDHARQALQEDDLTKPERE